MFIIEYFDRNFGKWLPMPSDAGTAPAKEFATGAAAEEERARLRPRMPACQLRITATVPA